MAQHPDDPNLRWDGQRWIQWNGSLWVDASTGEAISGQPANIPSQPQVKKSHTGRSLILVVVILLVLLVGGGSLLLLTRAGRGSNEAATGGPSASTIVSTSCQGFTYPKSQSNDICVDYTNTLTLDGLTMAAIALAPTPNGSGGRSLCSTLTLTNNSGKPQDFNVASFRVQKPDGDIEVPSSVGTPDGLTSGTLAEGAIQKGNVCVNDKGALGQYVLIYYSSRSSDQRGIWLTTVR